MVTQGFKYGTSFIFQGTTEFIILKKYLLLVQHLNIQNTIKTQNKQKQRPTTCWTDQVLLPFMIKKCQSLINCQALLRGYFGRWEHLSTYYCREEVSLTSPGEMAVIRGSTM